jgi:hypothetical protein
VVLRLVGSGPKIGGNLEVYMFRAKGGRRGKMEGGKERGLLRNEGEKGGEGKPTRNKEGREAPVCCQIPPNSLFSN